MEKSLYIFFSALFLLTMLVGMVLYVATFFDTSPKPYAVVELTLSYNTPANSGAIKKVTSQDVSDYQQNIILESVTPGKYQMDIAGLDEGCKAVGAVRTFNVYPSQNVNTPLLNIKCTKDSHKPGDFYIYLKDQGGEILLYEITNNLREVNKIAGKKVSAMKSSKNKRITFSARGDIAVLNTKNAELHYITKSAKDKQPSWSPDGSTIAFSSNRGGNNEIYSVNADGSNLKQLTDNKYSDTTPIWSPDGLKIAFNSNRDGNSEIFVLYPQNRKVRQITDNNQDNHAASWSPSGRSFVVLTEGWFGLNKICIVGFNGNIKRRLTYFATDISEGGSYTHNSSSYLVSYTNIWGNRRERRLPSVTNKDGVNKDYLTQLYE